MTIKITQNHYAKWEEDTKKDVHLFTLAFLRQDSTPSQHTTEHTVLSLPQPSSEPHCTPEPYVLKARAVWDVFGLYWCLPLLVHRYQCQKLLYKGQAFSAVWQLLHESCCSCCTEGVTIAALLPPPVLPSCWEFCYFKTQLSVTALFQWPEIECAGNKRIWIQLISLWLSFLICQKCKSAPQTIDQPIW